MRRRLFRRIGRNGRDVFAIATIVANSRNDFLRRQRNEGIVESR
jgi:hypothetical protein